VALVFGLPSNRGSPGIGSPSRPPESAPSAALEGADEGAYTDFPALVRGEFEWVWRLLRRFGVGAPDADDATQQVFIVVARNWHSLPVSRTRRFLYGTALRVAANARRTARRHPEVPDESSIVALLVEPTQSAELEQKRALELLDELLAELPDELRRVFVLAEIEQLSGSAIAELEEIPAGTVASRLRRARAAFVALLERERHRNPFGDHCP
jgi:RNA polymerase sigma-70 factor (ECF subfamily)